MVCKKRHQPGLLRIIPQTFPSASVCQIKMNQRDRSVNVCWNNTGDLVNSLAVAKIDSPIAPPKRHARRLENQQQQSSSNPSPAKQVNLDCAKRQTDWFSYCESKLARPADCLVSQPPKPTNLVTIRHQRANQSPSNPTSERLPDDLSQFCSRRKR